MPDAVKPQTPDVEKQAKMPPILNINDVELKPRPPHMLPAGPQAEKYDARLGMIGIALGAKTLGYSLTVVPPGKRAFPFHVHRNNEEMFYIIAGEGVLRFGAESYPVKPGDVIACVPGDASKAHQLVNTGSSDLKYLGVSTSRTPDICHYPDSGKFGVLDSPEGMDSFAFIGRPENGIPYWEGE